MFEVFIRLEVEPALRSGKKDEGVEEKGRNTQSRSSETFPLSAVIAHSPAAAVDCALVATQIARRKTQMETEGVGINGGKRNHVQLQAKHAPIWFPSKPSANQSHSGSRVVLLSIKSATQTHQCDSTTPTPTILVYTRVRPKALNESALIFRGSSQIAAKVSGNMALDNSEEEISALVDMKQDSFHLRLPDLTPIGPNF
ncbi:hypothetical protein K438DRAFT_1749860 [Mycena galopus ATCC 62051]|nr:hypothetical protein K438DRAFT_1749860 [Mycena galopus ATCC 62051]